MKTTAGFYRSSDRELVVCLHPEMAVAARALGHHIGGQGHHRGLDDTVAFLQLGEQFFQQRRKTGEPLLSGKYIIDSNIYINHTYRFSTMLRIDPELG